MGKSLNISKYDPGMLDVIEAVCETGKACPIPYPDETTAKRERFQFYGLIRAISASDHTLAPKVKQLVFALTGPARSTLIISLGAYVQSDFYTRVAEKHLNSQ